MNRTDILIIGCFVAVCVGVLASPLIPMAAKNTMIMGAHAQTQEKFFMILKLSNPHADTYQYNTTNYDVSDISSNMNKSLATYINKKIEFNLKDSKIGISNTNRLGDSIYIHRYWQTKYNKITKQHTRAKCYYTQFN